MRWVDPHTVDGWREWVRPGVGASELGILLGVDHRGTPRQVWERKRRIKPYSNPPHRKKGGTDSNNPVVREGIEQEDAARRPLCDRYNASPAEYYARCEVPSWLKLQLDSRLAGGEPVEIKVPHVTSWDGLKEQGRAHEMYEWHYPQVQAQIYALDAARGLLWVYHPDRGGIRVWVERDDDYIAQMIETVDDWVQRYLFGDEEPPITEGDVAEMEGDAAWKAEANDLIELRRQRREIEQQLEAKKQEFREKEERMVELLGEYSRGRGHGVSITHTYRRDIDYRAAAQDALSPAELEGYRKSARREVRNQLCGKASPLARGSNLDQC